MKARKALSFLAATAAGFSLLAASPATAYAAKPRARWRSTAGS